MLLMLRVLTVACAVLCLLFARAAFGQSPDPADSSTTLLRALVAESGWHGGDQSAVLHVLGRRAALADVSIEEMAVAYVSAFRAKLTARLQWVLSLDTSCTEPAHWPKNLLWSQHEARCLQTVARIERYRAGQLPDPCPTADHWGSRYIRRDVERALRAGWVLARCNEETRNYLWAVP